MIAALLLISSLDDASEVNSAGVATAMVGSWCGYSVIGGGVKASRFLSSI